MKKMKIVCIVLLVCLSAAAFCDEAGEPEVFNNAIGFVYTPSTPLDRYDDTLQAGLQFQHWFDKIGVQLTGCMYYNQDQTEYNADTLNREQFSKLDWKLLAGTQFILCTFDVKNLNWIKNDSVFRLYFWLNGGVGCKDQSINKQNLTYLYAGTGIGLEAVFWKHISLPLELGYNGQFLNDGGFGICGSAGVRFRF